MGRIGMPMGMPEWSPFATVHKRSIHMPITLLNSIFKLRSQSVSSITTHRTPPHIYHYGNNQLRELDLDTPLPLAQQELLSSVPIHQPLYLASYPQPLSSVKSFEITQTPTTDKVHSSLSNCNQPNPASWTRTFI